MGPQNKNSSTARSARLDFEDWLYGAVDLLASEYGWSMHDILFGTYPEDFFWLKRQIRMRKIDQYLMDASIVANPHKEEHDAKEFIDSLLSERRWFSGDPDLDAELDVTAFEAFRSKLDKESKTIKVK